MAAALDIIRWVGERIAGLHNVRTCTLHRNGYLIAQMWGGNLAHIYFADELPKARTVKKILQEATRVGVGVLYLLDAALLPADGSRTAPDDMLLSLHALYRDKIYTYRRAGDGFKIGQVHFKAYGRADEREVWYGPDLAIRALPCCRAWVKAPASLRGEWQIATFGSDSFWKDADYTLGRDRARQTAHPSSEDVFRQHNWSASAFTNLPGGAPGGIPAGMGGAYTPPKQAARPLSKLDRCYQALGLPAGASCEQVKGAFRTLARQLHPDVSHLPPHEAKTKFQAVYEAYKFIREQAECS